VRRLIVAGLTIGVVLGGLFGLAVVSFADCAGPDCLYQRMVGVSAHAVGVGVAGTPPACSPTSSSNSSNSFGTLPLD
jgi:hypothetical protein